ncbi:hypothetical protein N7470_005715 [Penicillium chermesinum]|nr:hypothetical protein N7470_005715 [Penicillium chermesinum]
MPAFSPGKSQSSSATAAGNGTTPGRVHDPQNAVSAARLNTRKKGIPTTALPQAFIAALQDVSTATDPIQRTSLSAYFALERVSLALRHE